MSTAATFEKVTISRVMNAPVEKVWEVFTSPEHIVKWNSASGDWHTPKAENDLRVGGKFVYRMEARDGSMGFDFGGVYDEVVANKRIVYTMDDGRRAEVDFIPEGNATKVVETFDAEKENPVEMQQAGWQAILDECAKYVEQL